MNIEEVTKKQTQGLKLKSNDKIVKFCSFNAQSQKLFISFVKFSLFTVIDLKAKSMYWNLPSMGRAIPLCCHSDLDNLVVAYDTNKIVVFDLHNK